MFLDEFSHTVTGFSMILHYFFISLHIYLFQANRGGGMSTSIFNKLKDILMLPRRFQLFNKTEGSFHEE
jgi:hypothetical protein